MNMKKNNQENSIIQNQQEILMNKAKIIRHQLTSCRAAFRLLEGAVLTGIIDAEKANKILPLLLKYEKQILNKQDFGKEFFELASKPLFKKLASNKYEKVSKNFLTKQTHKILIVDDKYTETGWKQVFSLLFGKSNIIGCNSKNSCIKYLNTNSSEISFILLDLKLPDKEEQGLDLLKFIVNDYPHIPVIIFSGSDSIIYARKALTQGAWDYFPKEPENQTHRNPIDYFITFFEIISKVKEYCDDYVDKYWIKIDKIGEDLNKFDNGSGAGLIKSVIRELKKAYKNLIFNDLNNYIPSFLEINHYDNVVLSCSKALEMHLKFITKLKSINTKYKIEKDETDKLYTTPIEEDIIRNIRGLSYLLRAIESNKNIISFSKNWYDIVRKLNSRRSKYIHGYLENQSYKSSKMKDVTKEDAIDFIKDTLFVITDSTDKLLI